MFNIRDYVSPKNESSLYKNIPMKYRHNNAIETLLRIYPCRIRYRGPRHDMMRLTTLKENAHAFSIYKRR